MKNSQDTSGCVQLTTMENVTDLANMRAIITNIVVMSGSQRAAARELRISTGYLGDILHGRREVGAELAAKLGWKRKVVFARDHE